MPTSAVAVLERFQPLALLFLLFDHTLNAGGQFADRGGQTVQLTNIVLQQLNALVLPTIFFFEPSTKLFVLARVMEPSIYIPFRAVALSQV